MERPSFLNNIDDQLLESYILETSVLIKQLKEELRSCCENSKKLQNLIIRHYEEILEVYENELQERQKR